MADSSGGGGGQPKGPYQILALNLAKQCNSEEGLQEVLHQQLDSFRGQWNRRYGVLPPVELDADKSQQVRVTYVDRLMTAAGRALCYFMRYDKFPQMSGNPKEWNTKKDPNFKKLPEMAKALTMMGPALQQLTPQQVDTLVLRSYTFIQWSMGMDQKLGRPKFCDAKQMSADLKTALVNWSFPDKWLGKEVPVDHGEEELQQLLWDCDAPLRTDHAVAQRKLKLVPGRIKQCMEPVSHAVPMALQRPQVQVPIGQPGFMYPYATAEAMQLQMQQLQLQQQQLQQQAQQQQQLQQAQQEVLELRAWLQAQQGQQLGHMTAQQQQPQQP
ncbi:hypothetical protein N2152v2_000236 [Parachlorella kessleri]